MDKNKNRNHEKKEEKEPGEECVCARARERESHIGLEHRNIKTNIIMLVQSGGRDLQSCSLFI